MRIVCSVRAFALLVVVFAVVISTPLKPCAEETQARSGPYIVGTEVDFPPYTVFDAEGRPSGFALELLQTVAEKAGINLQLRLGSWSSNREKLERGEIAIIPAMAKSPARAKIFDLTDTHSVAYDAIFVPENSTEIHSEADLPGHRIIVQKSDFAYEWLKAHADEEYKRTGREPYRFVFSSSVAEGLKLLLEGGGDAYVGSQLTVLAILQRMETKAIREAEKPMMTGYQREYAFAVNKSEVGLANRLNEGMRATLASGEYSRIYDRWFLRLDPQIRERQRKTEMLRNLAVAFGISLAVALAAMAMVVAFRREVNRKTLSLAESEMRFRNLVTNLPGVVFACEFDAGEVASNFQFTFISDFVDRITGYPASAFIGTKLYLLLKLLHPEDRDAAISTLIKNAMSRLRTDLEFRIVANDGSTHWIHAQASPPSVNPVNGRMVMNGILFDISATKNFANLLAQQQSKMAASARLSALGEMAGGIAHEINNPLAIISLRAHQLTQLARKGPVKPDDAKLVANGIETTAHRISKIVRSLKKVSRESEGDPFETVTIREIIEETFELCYQRMLNNGIRVVVDDLPTDANGDLTIACRRVQISQVLINILNNAFDAIVGLTDKRVRIEVRDLGEKIELTISNSGPPIPPELEHKIFQPFFTTKGVGKGTGLGLSISKGLIESHGGEIALATNATETRFVIVLPKRQAPAPTEGATRAVPQKAPPPPVQEAILDAEVTDHGAPGLT